MTDRLATVDATLLPVQAGSDRSHVADASLSAFVAAGVIATGALFSGDAVLQSFEATGQIQGPVPLEAFEVSGTIIPGEVLRAVVTLEAFEAAPGQGLYGSAALEAFTASATIARGDLAIVDAVLSSYSVDASIGRIGDASVVADLQAYTGAGSIMGGNVARVDATLELPTVSGTLIPGNVMRAVVEILPYEVQGTVYTNGTFTVDATLLPFTAQGVITGPAAAVTAAIAINTRTRAVTTHANAPFNSLCTFQGVLLGGTSAGLMRLEGDDDAGTPILGVLQSGVSNLGSDQQKRIPDALFGYRAAGDMLLTVIVDEDAEYEYDLEPRQGTNLHPTRVKLGRGLKGANWQWRLENPDGESFDINYGKLNVEDLSRRV